MGLIEKEQLSSLDQVEEVIRQRGLKSSDLTEEAVDALLDSLKVVPLQREYIRDEILWGAESNRYG